MPNKKQNELIECLMEKLNDNEKLFCESVINNLLELEYLPRKHRKSNFVVEFEKNGRIIVKIEIKPLKDSGTSLLFWLRFSGCKKYPKKFREAAERRPEAWIKRNQYYKNHNIEKCCGLCKGSPRFYYINNDDHTKTIRCGGYTIQIPGITSDDISDTLKLIKEQDIYFSNVLFS